MKSQIATVGAVLAVLVSPVAIAGNGQSNPTAPAGARGRVSVSPVMNEVTIIGCVELEKDYRQRMAAGRGGVLGSGVGGDDEFVLTNIRPAPDSASPIPKGTSGTGGGVYGLTGPLEANLKRVINRQVEVVGIIENAGKASTGADAKDISDLPRIVIGTWHPISDFCPGK